MAELARATAMSRSTFAERFKLVAEVPPLAYLTEWRMRLAERALREDNASLASLAQSLGYASESAFSHAFKRVTGHAPKQYRTAMMRRADSARADAHPSNGPASSKTFLAAPSTPSAASFTARAATAPGAPVRRKLPRSVAT